MTELSFSAALEAAKQGSRIQRAGWNGKDMFVYIVPAASYPAQRGAAKAWAGEDAMIPYGAYLAMKTVDGTVVPWLASQTDILADDWDIFAEPDECGFQMPDDVAELFEAIRNNDGFTTEQVESAARWFRECQNKVDGGVTDQGLEEAFRILGGQW